VQLQNYLLSINRNRRRWFGVCGGLGEGWEWIASLERRKDQEE
jgi:phage shock protein PspC (stress-responsive transcriptional regulator)